MTMYKQIRKFLLVLLTSSIGYCYSQNLDSTYIYDAYPFQLMFATKNNNLKSLIITNNSNKTVFIDTTVFFNKNLDSLVDYTISIGNTYILALDMVDINLQKFEKGDSLNVNLKNIGKNNFLTIHYINDIRDIKRVKRMLNKRKGFFSMKKGKILISREIFNHTTNHIRICCFEKEEFRINDLKITGIVVDTKKLNKNR